MKPGPPGWFGAAESTSRGGGYTQEALVALDDEDALARVTLGVWMHR